MGSTTIVLLNNDCLSDYKKDGQKTIDYICGRAGAGERDAIYTGPKYNIKIPVITHSSDCGLLAFGHNTAFIVGYGRNNIDISEKEGKITLLKDVAERLGYKLVKK